MKLLMDKFKILRNWGNVLIYRQRKQRCEETDLSHVALKPTSESRGHQLKKEKWSLGGSMFCMVQKVIVASIFLSEMEFLFEGFQKMLKYQKLNSDARLPQEIGSRRIVVRMKRYGIQFLW